MNAKTIRAIKALDDILQQLPSRKIKALYKLDANHAKQGMTKPRRYEYLSAVLFLKLHIRGFTADILAFYIVFGRLPRLN